MNCFNWIINLCFLRHMERMFFLVMIQQKSAYRYYKEDMIPSAAVKNKLNQSYENFEQKVFRYITWFGRSIIRYLIEHLKINLIFFLANNYNWTVFCFICFTVARFERFHDSSLGAETTEAQDARLLPNDVVAQSRNRSHRSTFNKFLIWIFRTFSFLWLFEDI